MAEATHQHEMVPVAAPSGAAANEDVPVFPCSQVLPTALDGKTFAHEAVKARPFCGRYVQIAESDNLLREGPAVCPNGVDGNFRRQVDIIVAGGTQDHR